MRIDRTWVSVGLVLALAGCGRGQEEAPPAPQASFITVQPTSATLTTELPGRTSALQTSEVRPQVNGIVTARLFEEGQMVRQGQALYRIDAAPYQAQVESARAALARARATVASTSELARRYAELVEINAISRQEAENAAASADQARADVAVQEAALRAAQIDLGRTVIRAPISGRIGRSSVTVGALVSAAQAAPLSTIQNLSSVYVDIPQSSTDLLRLRQQLSSGQLNRPDDAAPVRLKLEDGSTYPLEGTLKFAEVSVDPQTGSQVIRAQFPNPQGLLLPGMFVRAELIEGEQPNVILAPQRAVSRNERGEAVVNVIGADNKLQPRIVTAPRTQGQDWVVTSGLKAGDRLVMESAQVLVPGAVVRPVPYQAGAQPARPASAPTKQEG